MNLDKHVRSAHTRASQKRRMNSLRNCARLVCS